MVYGWKNCRRRLCLPREESRGRLEEGIVHSCKGRNIVWRPSGQEGRDS